MSRTLGPGDRNSSKHCLPNDLLPFLEREQTIVVYHHLGRRGPAWQQLAEWKTALQETLALPRRPMALRYLRGSPRAYLVILGEEDRRLVEMCLQRFLETPWAQHFQWA